MSAANRGAIRQEADFYRTDPRYTKPLIAQFDPLFLSMARFLEPCKGDGAIVDLFRPLVGGVDWAEIREGRDYLAMEYEDRADLIVTNPPYSLAQEFITKTLDEAATVAHLLRLNFLGSQARREWWQTRAPSHLFVLSERPAFVAVCKGWKEAKAAGGKKHKGCGRSYPLGTGGRCECGGRIARATDATEYAWFVWDRIGLVMKDPGVYVL